MLHLRTAQPFAVELPASSRDGFLGSRRGYVHPPEHAPQASLRVVLTLEAWLSLKQNTVEICEIGFNLYPTPT